MTDSDILMLAAKHRITVVAGSLDGSPAALLAFAREVDDIGRADETSQIFLALDEQAKKMQEAPHA